MRAWTIAFAIVALAGCSKQPEPVENSPAAEAAGLRKGVDRSHKGEALPAVTLRNDKDEDQTLDEFREGGPVLVNLWATWCAPCVKELPTLDELSRSFQATPVIALSQDTAPRTSVNAFAKRLGITALPIWHDPKMSFSGAAKAEVLPTTILYDKNGRELWRYVGDLDWSSEEAAKLLAESYDR